MRARLTATERGTLAASFAGYLLVGLGIVLFLTASAVLAGALALAGIAILWLAGVWVLPFTRDAYHRRAERILGDWTGEAPETVEEVEVYGRWTLERLEGLRGAPPEHARLTAALSAYLDALGQGEEAAVHERHAMLDRELGELEERRLAAWRG